MILLLTILHGKTRETIPLVQKYFLWKSTSFYPSYRALFSNSDERTLNWIWNWTRIKPHKLQSLCLHLILYCNLDHKKKMSFQFPIVWPGNSSRHVLNWSSSWGQIVKGNFTLGHLPLDSNGSQGPCFNWKMSFKEKMHLPSTAKMKFWANIFLPSSLPKIKLATLASHFSVNFCTLPNQLKFFHWQWSVTFDWKYLAGGATVIYKLHILHIFALVNSGSRATVYCWKCIPVTRHSLILKWLTVSNALPKAIFTLKMVAKESWRIGKELFFMQSHWTCFELYFFSFKYTLGNSCMDAVIYSLLE